MTDGALQGRRIGLLTASASRLGGGVFEAVAAQAAMIRAASGEALIFALADAQSEADRARFAPSSLTLAAVTGPAQIGYAPRLLADLLAADLDLLHVHGIWMAPSHAGRLWAQRSGRPYLISPHGMLDPWITARGRWKKALARAGYERASWRSAYGFHALTNDEARDIGRESGRREIVIIPNAAPAIMPPGPEPRAPLVAFIGRIHPKKNLAGLVAGWRRASLPVASRLTIAGWGEPQDIADLQRAIGAGDGTVQFVGPLYGADKQALLSAARFTILPSLSEGLPMAVLEGWAAGTPAILTPACHLPAGLAQGAALPCGPEPATIAAALTQAFAVAPAQWSAMSNAALALAAGPFGAAHVAARWAEVYERAIAGHAMSERP